jgi:hypothetical protein
VLDLLRQLSPLVALFTPSTGKASLVHVRRDPEPHAPSAAAAAAAAVAIAAASASAEAATAAAAAAAEAFTIATQAPARSPTYTSAGVSLASTPPAAACFSPAAVGLSPAAALAADWESRAVREGRSAAAAAAEAAAAAGGQGREAGPSGSQLVSAGCRPAVAGGSESGELRSETPRRQVGWRHREKDRGREDDAYPNGVMEGWMDVGWRGGWMGGWVD